MSRGLSTDTIVLITFLNKVDGVDGESRDSVLVLGVINWPWTLDVALLRPGILIGSFYVPTLLFLKANNVLRMDRERACVTIYNNVHRMDRSAVRNRAW